jgi:AcrR family transcriptional regulator
MSATSTHVSLAHPTGEESPRGTRERLLEAAEFLIGERGFKVTSLREITERAEANVAAVNYHFGSKDGLYVALFESRFRQVNAHRLRLLDVAERLAGDQPVPPRVLLDALLRPITAIATGYSASPHPFAKVMGRFMLEPDPILQPIFEREFEAVRVRFGAALLRNFPHLEGGKLRGRVRFILGATIHALAGIQPLPMSRLGAPADPSDLEAEFQDLLTFAEAGLASPVPVDRSAA